MELDQERKRLESERAAAVKQQKAAALGYDRQLAEVNAKIAELKREREIQQKRIMTSFITSQAKLKTVLGQSYTKPEVEQAARTSTVHRQIGLELLMRALGTEERKAKEIQALIDKIE